MRLRIMLITALIAGLLLVGCSSQESGSADDPATTTAKLEVKYDTPAAMDVPARLEPTSDTDWESITKNKDAEIVEVLNIINPVAAFIVAGFEQYEAKFSEITHEEWEDTQAQLGAASTLYGDCTKRMEAGAFDRQLFLDLEESWQLFVKVGVAGVRTKTMIEADLSRVR